MNNFKKILPLILLTLFIFLINYYYQRNKEDFFGIQYLDKSLLIQILILCFFYLLTEGLVLKNIVNFLNKKISFIQSFLVMSATYFCNTFIQFSGLGYRVYYLKRFKNLKILETLRFSIDTIACEVLVFSLIGTISISLIDLNSEKIGISIVLYLIFTFFLLSSIIYLFFISIIILKFQNILNKLNFFKLNKILEVFILKKKNIFFFYKKQLFVFFFQYLILFFILFLIINKMGINNYFYLSLLITSLIDFSFLIALTPYSVGISELITFFGTRDIPLTLAEIIILINIFRISMLLIYFVCGPIFIIFNLKKGNYGM